MPIQRRLFKDFFKVIARPLADNHYDLQRMGTICHGILVSLLKTEQGLDLPIANVVEQVLAVHMFQLLPERQVRCTNLFTQRCAHMQRILLSTLVHAGVLKGFEAEYKLPLDEAPQDEESLNENLEPTALETDSTSGPHPGDGGWIQEEIAELDAHSAAESATEHALLHLSKLGNDIEKRNFAVTGDGPLAQWLDRDDLDDGSLAGDKDTRNFVDPSVGADTTILSYVLFSFIILYMLSDMVGW